MKNFEIIDEETYEQIILGIRNRSNQNSWTIYSEISKNVIEKLKLNGYKVKQNLTSTTINW